MLKGSAHDEEGDELDRNSSDGREIELKLEVAPECDAALLETGWLNECLGDVQQTISTYYDTKAKQLSSAGLTLRVREAGGRFVQTLKSDAKASAGLFDRNEWEAPVSGPEPDLNAVAAGIEPLSSPDIRAGLKPVFQTLVGRRAAEIAHNGSRIELVLDRGELVAGDRRQQLFEIELELIEGSPAALFGVARKLQAHVPLRLGVMSKSERGERLADGRDARPLKAEPLELDRDMSAGEAFAAIALACLRHFRANEPLILTDRNPDALHQARVALRRLRSSFSLFKPILKGAEFDRFREETRDLAATLGLARNLDVLAERRGDQLSKESRKRLEKERQKAYDLAIAKLESPATGAMFIDLAEWISLGKRQKRKISRASIAPFADQVLAKFWMQVSEPGRHLLSIDDTERHELRIAGKKLRYAGEFFSALYEERHSSKRDRFLSGLEKLQDKLGALNDLATEKEMAESLEALGIILPQGKTKNLRDERRVLLKESADAFEALEKSGPYWN